MTALFTGKPWYFFQELYLMISITGLGFKVRPLDQQYQHHLKSWQTHRFPTPYEIYCVRSPKGKAQLPVFAADLQGF